MLYVILILLFYYLLIFRVLVVLVVLLVLDNFNAGTTLMFLFNAGTTSAAVTSTSTHPLVSRPARAAPAPAMSHFSKA